MQPTHVRRILLPLAVLTVGFIGTRSAEAQSRGGAEEEGQETPEISEVATG